MVDKQILLDTFKMLYSIIKAEKEVEVTRQVLAELKDFEPYSAFRRIDKYRKNYLTNTDIQEFLEQNKIEVNKKEINSIFKKWDGDSDGRLTYSDFMYLVLPKENRQLAQMSLSRQNYIVDETLPYEVEWGVARVIQQEIVSFGEVEGVKAQQLGTLKGKLKNVFKELDRDNQGKLTVGKIQDFLVQYRPSVSESDVRALIRRIDLDKDNEISYSEFYEGLILCNPTSLSPIKLMQQQQQQQELKSRKSSEMNESRELVVQTIKKQQERNQFISPLRTTTREVFRSPLREFLTPKKTFSNYMQQSSLETQTETSTLASPLLTKSILKQNIQEYNTPEKYQSKLLTQSLRKNTQETNQKYYNTKQQKHFLLDQSKITQQKEEMNRRGRLGQEQMKLMEEAKRSFVWYLKELIDAENQIERLKCDLALRHDFNLIGAFRLFDFEGKSYFEQYDLKERLHKLNVKTNPDQLYLLFNRIDLDSDGKIRYPEFCQFLLPKSEEYANILNQRVPKYSHTKEEEEIISQGTLLYFSVLWQQVIKVELRNEYMRQNLVSNSQLSINAIYEWLDVDNDGYITLDIFKRVLQEYDFYPSSKDISYLMSKFDRDRDGRITQSEFNLENTPKL